MQLTTCDACKTGDRCERVGMPCSRLRDLYNAGLAAPEDEVRKRLAVVEQEKEEAKATVTTLLYTLQLPWDASDIELGDLAEKMVADLTTLRERASAVEVLFSQYIDSWVPGPGGTPPNRADVVVARDALRNVLEKAK